MIEPSNQNHLFSVDRQFGKPVFSHSQRVSRYSVTRNYLQFFYFTIYIHFKTQFMMKVNSVILVIISLDDV